MGSTCYDQRHLCIKLTMYRVNLSSSLLALMSVLFFLPYMVRRSWVTDCSLAKYVPAFLDRATFEKAVSEHTHPIRTRKVWGRFWVELLIELQEEYSPKLVAISHPNPTHVL